MRESRSSLFICSQKPFHLPDEKQYTKRWLPPAFLPPFLTPRQPPPRCQDEDEAPLRSPCPALLGSQGLGGSTQT